MDTAPDFRTEEPVWVRYAEWISSAHDKYYEVRIDMDEGGKFWITKRWGRRPDAGGGQTKAGAVQSMSAATAAATGIINAKLAKGYVECDRPFGAGQRVEREHGADYYADEEAF